MALQSDKDGFLIGTPIDLGVMIDHLTKLKIDVAAIRKAIIPAAAASKKAAEKPAPVVVSTPRQRDQNGRFVSSNQNSNVAQPARRPGSAPVSANAFGSSKIAVPLKRVAETAASADPVAAQASREIAQPLKRGFAIFAGNEQKRQTRTLDKIFKTLNLFQKQETTYNKAEKNLLQDIKDKPVSSGSSSFSLGGLGGGLKGGLGGLLTGAGIGAKGILRRIPILGTLLTALGAAFDISTSETDPNLSRDQKNLAAGKSIGGLGGTLGGIGAGASLGSIAGPIGTVVGGVVGGFLGDQAGQIIGQKFAEWVNELKKSDIPGKIISTVKDWASSLNIGDNFKKVADVAKEQLNDANNYIKGATGIDPKKSVASFLQSTKDSFQNAKDSFLNNTTVGQTISKISQVIRGSGNKRVFQREDGSIETREGGSRSFRNNNPGNIEFGDYAKSHGAIGTDGRFAIFESLEAGRKAKENLLFNGKNYRDKKLSDAIERYAPSFENDTNAYKKAVLASVGGIDKPLKDYSPLERSAILSSIEKHEGFKPGTVSVASYSAPSAPTMPSVPPIPAAPEIQVPLSSPKKEPLVVNLPDQDIWQGLSDRGLAHIAAGGMGYGGYTNGR